MSVDAAIARIESELPDWGWSVFTKVEEYQAQLWDRADVPPEEGDRVFAIAASPAEALVMALDKAKAGEFCPKRKW